MSVEARHPLRALEVAIVCLGLVPLFQLLDATGVMAWQELALPYPFGSELGVLVGVPLALTLLARRNLAREGLAVAATSAPRQLALVVIGMTWLSTLAFLPLPALGESYSTPVGAAILAVAMASCGVGMLAAIRRQPSVDAPQLDNRRATLRLLAVLGLGVLVVVVTAGRIPFAARIAGNVLLTAFCEELFFRGYVQGGLDAAWGRRWNPWGFRIGPGLFVAAALFGAFHLVPFIATGRAVPWPWAIWTAVFGVFAGALRAKTDTMTLPWIMHGTLLAIRAFGGR